MGRRAEPVDVYLEAGKHRVFAGAVEWPGWCRSGRDEGSALQALLGYGPRYARAMRTARLGFSAPDDLSAFNVVERLAGDTTTDFGAPGAVPSSDARPLDEAELRRQSALLRACWRALDAALESAVGKELRKGPRGGGRDADRILEHVLGAEGGYLSALGRRHAPGGNPGDARAHLRKAMLDTLAAAQRGELPERGPRGGKHWSPRYFVRREAWHVLDHAWEIEDRIL